MAKIWNQAGLQWHTYRGERKPSKPVGTAMEFPESARKVCVGCGYHICKRVGCRLCEADLSLNVRIRELEDAATRCGIGMALPAEFRDARRSAGVIYRRYPWLEILFYSRKYSHLDFVVEALENRDLKDIAAAHADWLPLRDFMQLVEWREACRRKHGQIPVFRIRRERWQERLKADLDCNLEDTTGESKP
jgi:hypothetical protein